jgi:pyrroline-5-carboxylate reductase
MKRDTATEILAGSLLAAAKMIQHGEHPAVLREKISSPRGTTIQGLKTIEKGGVRSTYTDATIDSVHHGLNMGKK